MAVDVQRRPRVGKSELDDEIERLRNEIKQETQMKEMLNQSSKDLEKTITELEQKYESIDGEENEWKTRYETQQEINQQLGKQIALLRDKLESLKTPKDGQQSTQMKTYDSLSDADIKKLIKQLERDKRDLEGQLRDLEWRLDNESQAYHKINEERKNYETQINEAMLLIDDNKSKQRNALMEAQKEHDAQFKHLAANNNAVFRNRHQNETFGLPDNQRIIDPKKGPIKKTAAVRKLPKLDTSPGSSNGSFVSSTGNTPRESPRASSQQ